MRAASLPLVLTTVLVLALAGPASGADRALRAPGPPFGAAVPASGAGTALKSPPFAQRRGVFRPRTTRPGSRPGFRPRTQVRRSPSLRRVGRDVLRFLGIAYLLNLLFGWGPGGSPLGLLLVLGFIAWLVTRRRRRTAYYAHRH